MKKGPWGVVIYFLMTQAPVSGAVCVGIYFPYMGMLGVFVTHLLSWLRIIQNLVRVDAGCGVCLVSIMTHQRGSQAIRLGGLNLRCTTQGQRAHIGAVWQRAAHCLTEEPRSDVASSPIGSFSSFGKVRLIYDCLIYACLSWTILLLPLLLSLVVNRQWVL